MISKICIIGPHFPVFSYPCGAADFIFQLAWHLQESGLDVTVLTSNPNARQDIPFKVEIIEGSWGLFHILKIIRFLSQQKFDLVDVQFETFMFNNHGPILLLPLWLKRLKIRSTLTLHSQYLPRGGKLWRLAQMLLFEKIIFYSQAMKESWEKKLPAFKQKFFWQGFPSNIVELKSLDFQKFSLRLKLHYYHDKKILVYFGHINPHRGLEDVLNTLVQLKEKKMDFLFMLLGQFKPQENSYHRELLAKVRGLKLEREVHFTDRLDERAVSEHLQLADLAVLPFPEGASFKNGSLAAMVVHQVPVVTTKTTLTEDVLLRSEGLATYSPGDSTALYQKLIELIQSPQKLQQMKEKMFELKELYSWEEYTHSRVKIYQQ